MEKLIETFLQEKLTITQLSKKFKKEKDEVIQILKEFGFLYAKSGRTSEVIINLKNAADEYFRNNKITLRDLEIKHQLSIGTLSKYLKEFYGIKIEVRKKVIFNDTIFDVIDTEEKAYWLGFIYADGYIDSAPLIDGKKNNYQLEVSLKLNDIDHLNKLKEFFNSSKEIKSDFHRCRFYLSSKHLWNILNNYGCTPKKSLTLKFPDEYIFKSKDLIRHFIRGYFDGDGCLSWANKEHTSPSIQILGTFDFISQLKKYLPIELQDLKISHNHNNSEESTRYISTSSKKAMIFLNFIYENATIYLNRKFERYCYFKLPPTEEI